VALLEHLFNLMSYSKYCKSVLVYQSLFTLRYSTNNERGSPVIFVENDISSHSPQLELLSLDQTPFFTTAKTPCFPKYMISNHGQITLICGRAYGIFHRCGLSRIVGGCSINVLCGFWISLLIYC
jgi:hypothetical protein